MAETIFRWFDVCAFMAFPPTPCKMISPILNQIAEERDITIAKVNTDMNPLSMGKFGFRGIPALVLFHNGQAVDQMTGARPKPMFDQWLGKYMD